jgi:hypothetical protein
VWAQIGSWRCQPKLDSTCANSFVPRHYLPLYWRNLISRVLNLLPRLQHPQPSQSCLIPSPVGEQTIHHRSQPLILLTADHRSSSRRRIAPPQVPARFRHLLQRELDTNEASKLANVRKLPSLSVRSLQLLRIRHIHAAELRAPLVIRGVADAVLAARLLRPKAALVRLGRPRPQTDLLRGRT